MTVLLLERGEPKAIFQKLIELGRKDAAVRELPEEIEHYLLRVLLHFYAVGEGLQLPQDDALALMLEKQLEIRQPRERLLKMHTVARLGLFIVGHFPRFRLRHMDHAHYKELIDLKNAVDANPKYYRRVTRSAYANAEDIMLAHRELRGYGPPFGTVEYLGALEKIMRSMRRKHDYLLDFLANAAVSPTHSGGFRSH